MTRCSSAERQSKTTSMNIVINSSSAFLVRDTVRPLCAGFQRRRRAHAAALALTVASSGGTTLEGRVLRADDDVPLQGVTLRIGATTTQTDAAGRFFFATAPAGTQIMMIDGTTVTSPPGTYHTLPAQVTLVANQANVLPFVSYLPLVDTTVKSTLNPATTSIIQDPRIPGLSFTIPTGTELRSDLDGSLITDVAITPVSPSRIPLPAPGPGLHVDPGTIYMMYFFKPGGAIPTQKITQFALPNDLASAPGRNIIFYYFDSSPTVQPGTNQWKLAGTGKISADGKLALPDPGVGFPKFCCALIFWCNAEGATEGNTSPDDNDDVDPVDLATGQLVLKKTDLVLPARLSMLISRGYQGGRKGSAGPFGKGTFFNFERQAQPTESGLVITYAQGNGRIDLLTRQPDGTFRNTTIASLRGLVLTVNPDGSKTIVRRDKSIEHYSTAGRLIGLEDRNGNTITIERDASDLITRIIDASGLRALTFQYDAGGRILQITDPINRFVQYTYNAAGYLETIVDPAGGTTRYTYDGTGNLLSVIDPRGISILTNQYDPLYGTVERQTLGDGAVYAFTYGRFGTTITDTTVIDPIGNRRTTRFNAQGYSAGMTSRIGLQTRKIFDQNNQITEQRDPLNRVTRVTYDSAGNISSLLDPQGNSALFEYEPLFNRATRVTDTLGQASRFTYDNKGNILTATNALNQTTTLTYDQFGQPASVRNPLGHVVVLQHDEFGNLVRTTDSLGAMTTKTYDMASRITSVTDPKGNTTKYLYNPLNQVTTIIDAGNNETRFTYDGNGNLLSVIDARNGTTTITYDNMDRVKIKTDTLNRPESYDYDLLGNIVRFTDRKGQITRVEYDALNRKTKTIYPDGSEKTFTYDSAGRLVKRSDSQSGTTIHAYNALDEMVEEITPQGIVSYQHDALGRRTQMVASGQVPVSYQYDAASRLTQIAKGALVVNLGYDDAGRRISVTYSNGITTSYAYDASSQLTNILHQKSGGAVIENLSYTYDTAGNRTGLVRTNGTASLLPNAVFSTAYDLANQQTGFAGSTLTYDQNGNLVNDGVSTYTWDARNRLIGISGNVTASFSYDTLGRRSSRTINGTTTTFLYDGLTLVQETNGTTVTASLLSNLGLDDAFIRTDAGGNRVFLQDAIASTVALADDAGAVSTQYAYAPYGATTQSGPGSTNTLKYTGREDDGSGLYYYRARYYHPTFQRFISQDPLGFTAGDINTYNYVRNNPVRYTDPRGLFVPWIHRWIARIALKAEGCSDEFSEQVANWDVQADQEFDAFLQANAYIHGQVDPAKPSLFDTISDNKRHIEQNMALGNEKGLGYAMHSTEDPYSPSHQWSVALPGNSFGDIISDPSSWGEWLQHLWQDMFPGDSFCKAVDADRQLIRQWKKMWGKDACQ